MIEVVPARGQVPHLLEQITRAGRGRRARAGDDAHQAAGRGPVGLSQRAGRDAASGCTASWTPSSACELLRELREGRFDALVGVNLLREGLDLPEVSLVAILDADKEGFLRSETSLIQTIGRAARNVNAKVILYADKVTDSMQRAIDETRPPPRVAGSVQRRARHHARDDQQERSARASRRKRRPTPRPTRRSAAPTRRSTSPRNTSPSWKPRCSPRPNRSNSSAPRRSATASRRCASRLDNGSAMCRRGPAAGTRGGESAAKARAGAYRGRNAGKAVILVPALRVGTQGRTLRVAK